MELEKNVEALMLEGWNETDAWVHQLVQGTPSPGEGLSDSLAADLCDSLTQVLNQWDTDQEMSGEFAAAVIRLTFDKPIRSFMEVQKESIQLRVAQQTLAKTLVLHPSLTAAGATKVVYLSHQWMNSVGKNSILNPLEGPEMERLVELLGRGDVVSTSLLGTTWRLFANKADDYGLSLTILGMERNENYPMPVFAHHYPFQDLAVPADEQERIAARLTDAFPELADLPLQMMLDVAATQPLPADWFVDTFPLHSNVRLLAPRVSRP